MKKILAFTLALAMVLSTMTTTFAASKEVEALANLKLLLNTTDAEVNTELNRAVGLAMVLKALGYTQADADAKAADNKFVDMESASWAKGFATLGEELKLTNGVSVEPKMFAPAEKLSKQSFVTFMLRALGYDSNDAWAKAGELAKEAKLVSEATLEDASFTKGEAAVVMYNALKAMVQGDAKKRSLAQKLVDEGKLDKELAVANELVSGEPEKLEVASVKADNLREAIVMFNGTVNKETAEKVGNYKVSGKTFGTAKVMEDGKTVVLTLNNDNAFENNKALKLTVNGVKNAAGIVMAKQEVSFTPKDTEYPVVKDVVFTGPKSLEITFSEPIKKEGKVTLKAGNSSLSATAKKSDGNEKVVEVTMFTSLKDGTEYLVAVGDPKKSDEYAKDYANYPNIYFEGTYTYTADKTAPEAKVVSADQKVVVVEFNKPVSGLTAKHFYHSFAAYTAKDLWKDADMKKPLDKNTAVSKVWVRFYDETKPTSERGNALPAGNVQLTILGEANKVKIQDNWKNTFASTNYDLTIVADREAPEVVTAEVTGEKEIKVTFNEKISNLTERERYTLLDKDGKEIEKGSKLNRTSEDGGKTVKLGLSESYAGKTVTLQIKGIKDASLYQNMMSDYTTTIEFTDKSWKGVKTVEFKREPGTSGANYKAYVFVNYDEDMDDSAINVDNYKFMRGNETVKVKGNAEFFEGKASIVKIELSYEWDKDNSVAKKGTDAYFVAGNGDTVTANTFLLVNNAVKDLAGNANSNFQSQVEIKQWDETTYAPKIDKIEAVDPRKVVVKFNKELTNIKVENFKLKNHDGLSYNVVDLKTLEIILKEDDSLGTGEWADRLLEFTRSNETTDVYGRWLEKAATTDANTTVTGDVVAKNVADKIAPAVAAFRHSSANTASSATNAAAYPVAPSNNVLTKVENLDKKPVIKVEDDGTDYTGLNGSDEKEVVVKAKVFVKYTESLDRTTLSTTTYSFNNSFGLREGGNQIGGMNNEVTILIQKKIKTKKNMDDFKKEVRDLLNDLTITQVNAIKDLKGNTMSGSSNAMDVLDLND